VVATAVGAGLFWLLSRKPVSISIDRVFRHLPLMVFCATIPPAVLFVFSAVSDVSIMMPRYLLSYAPAIALLGGYGIASLRPAGCRISIAATLVLMCLATAGPSLWIAHESDDWRTALAIVRRIRTAQPDIPLLAVSSFIDSARLPLPRPAEEQQAFLAPLTAYPIPGAAVMLPPAIQDFNRSYVDSALDAASRSQRFVALIPNSSALLPLMEGRFAPEFHQQQLYANPTVLLFEKRRDRE
jgi:hypothetical protein